MEEEKSFQKLKHRGKNILTSGRWSDVSFLVGITTKNQRCFSAHQLFLAMASPVFDRMFYGYFPLCDESIVITDINPDTFKTMLDYIYTDLIVIESFDKACELLYASKKYMIPHLAGRCMSFMVENLSPINACRSFEIAKLFDEPCLMEWSMELIVAQTRKVIVAPSFFNIEISTLMTILEQNELNVESEEDLYNALFKFANERGVEVNDGDNNNSTGSSSSVSNIADEGTAVDSIFPAFPMVAQHTIMTEDMLRQAIIKIRSITIKPQQFVTAPTRLNHRKLFTTMFNISSPTIVPMPERFRQSHSSRSSSYSQSEHSIASTSYPTANNMNNRNQFYYFNHSTRALDPADVADTSSSINPISSASGGHQPNISPTEILTHYGSSDGVHRGVEGIVSSMTRSYCVRNFTHQNVYQISEPKFCSVTFQTDTNIWFLGFQIHTQTFGERLCTSRYYTEQIYSHLECMHLQQWTYGFGTDRVRYDSLLDIIYENPLYIQRNEMYRFCGIFKKFGWYTMKSYQREVESNNVKFTFGTGLLDGLIHAIIFSKP